MRAPVFPQRTATLQLALLAAGAVLLRLLLFLGRGDYVAFDEGWYLLVGRNLLHGAGYTLSGLRHVTLSPLFPILAGTLDLLIGSPVWAGRLVAATAAGLLVLPCYFVFRRLSGHRTALLGAALVAVMPSLAPFVVPFWIGWDLWVGAEPVMHLFLWTGIAFALRATDTGRVRDAALAGAAFALAYLARPEALVIGGLVGAAAVVAALRRRPRRAVLAVVAATAFGLVAAPYWLYLHDTLGRWSLSGRYVEMVPLPVRPPADGAGTGDAAANGRSGAAAALERALWISEADYARRLYSLTPDGLRLASSYWGVPPAEPPDAASSEPAAPGQRPEDAGAAPRAAAPEQAAEQPGPGILARLATTLRLLVPWLVWPLALLGAAALRRQPRAAEWVVGAPLLLGAVLVAAIVALDPRTQLFLVPLIAYYAARGTRVVGALADRRRGGRRADTELGLRRGFTSGLIAAVLLVVLLGTSARRLYMSLAVGSPHHVVAEQNRAAGEALRARVPPGRPIMSWHPALALYADRDWRVLPYAPFDDIVRYARANDALQVALSVYYPAPDIIEQSPEPYLLVQVPAGTGTGDAWTIDIVDHEPPLLVGRLRAAR